MLSGWKAEDGDAEIQRLKEKILMLEHDLSQNNIELIKIKSSTSWKITLLFRLLGRFFRNPRIYILSFIELIFRKTYRPSLIPLNGLKLVESRWEAVTNDPQFQISEEWPLGLAKVSINIKPEGSVSGHARLYVDRGLSYDENDSYDLGEVGIPNQFYVPLGLHVKRLRLDPLDSTGKFTLVDFKIQRVSYIERYLTIRLINIKAKIGRLFNFIRYSKSKAKDWYKKRGRLPRLSELSMLVRKAYFQWRSNSLSTSRLNAPNRFEFIQPLDPYDAWLEVNQWNLNRQLILEKKMSILNKEPLMSIVMPVYNPPINYLERAIDSVINQIYTNWELCIADDASSNPEVRKILEKFMKQDDRIKVEYRAENGNISMATNSAANLASGDYLVLMDNDDELTIDALAEIALFISMNPQTEVLYSDDDKINDSGKRFDPQFKPDWSPELLISYMYFSHIFVVSKSIYWKVGGMRVGYEGAQDYDLALRVTELTSHIGHIPKILYHWRVLPGSTASSGHEKPQSFEAGRKAIQEALDRRSVSAEVYQPNWALKAGCGIYSHRFSDYGPTVCIIIPMKNKVELLKRCLDSLVNYTTYKNYEVLIIDNESDDPEALSYLKSLSHNVLRIQNPNGKFNYAAIHNEAVKYVKSECILFLNNDTEVISPNWLSQMVGYLGIAGVGIVGARLIFPDNRIQHAGVIHGLYKGMVGPAFKLSPNWDNGYLSYSVVTRNYLAITAACMLTKKDLFVEIGGFDEENFGVAYNDVDYCYKLHKQGHRIVYCPSAELYHYEGYTRGYVDNPVESAAFRSKYGDVKDPFYNPNLSLENERFKIESRTIVTGTVPLIRTLICSFTLDWTGAALHQYELTVKLKEQGIIDPIVYCPNEGPLRKLYEENGIHVEVLKHPLNDITGISSYHESIEKFSQYIKNWNVGLVYGNTYQSFYCIDIASRLGIPTVWNIHESEPWQTYFNYFGDDIALHALRCMQHPYKVIFVSDATREGCKELDSHQNFMTIYNGINRNELDKKSETWPKEKARNYLNINGNEIVILLLGTVCERKGQIDLLEAIKHIPYDIINILRFIIVGDRPSEYSTRLWQLYNSLDDRYKKRIDIISETPETSLYYSASDIFLCTSRVESFPRVTLEAMAFGLPIISTPVYGIKEQVQNGVNGIFYSPGDYVTLAQTIIKLSQDLDLRNEMSYNSEYVLQLINDFDTMVKSYGEVFSEAWLSGKHRIAISK